MTYVLAIGDRSYSSWSLRGWLTFAKFGIPVTVRMGRLYTPEIREMLARDFAGARTVPALRIEEPGGTVAIWDTLAIAETRGGAASRRPASGRRTPRRGRGHAPWSPRCTRASRRSATPAR